MQDSCGSECSPLVGCREDCNELPVAVKCELIALLKFLSNYSAL